jgi:thioredoxin 1
VTDDTFEAEVLRNSHPVIVEYWAERCGPCRVVAPVVDSIAADCAGQIDLVTVNVDENPATVRKTGSWRCQRCMFVAGELVKQVNGARSKAALLREFGGFVMPSTI